MESLSFYADPYLACLDAKVAQAEKPTEAQYSALRLALGEIPPDVCALRLDRTICYPEGGGQPGDRGRIVFDGQSIPILATLKLRNNVKGRRGAEEEGHGQRANPSPGQDGRAGLAAGDAGQVVPVHLAACPPETLKAGDDVRIVLDWERRYLYMRLHTTQHLLSGLLWSSFGIKTVSVHLGDGEISIETDRAAIPEKEISCLEDLANDKILEGLTVSSLNMSQECAQKLDLRRSIKVDGEVRIVRIDTVDQVACGGLHVRRTSECGLVAYQGQEKIRGHIRLFFKAGGSARNQRKEDRRIIGALCALRSERPGLLVGNVKALQDALEKERAENSRLALRLAEAVLKEKTSISNDGVAAFVAEADLAGLLSLDSFAGASDLFDDLALAVLQREHDRLLWLVVLKGRYERIPFAVLKKTLLDKLGAKGGGRSPIFRGMARPASDEEIALFVSEFVKAAKEIYGR